MVIDKKAKITYNVSVSEHYIAYNVSVFMGMTRIRLEVSLYKCKQDGTILKIMQTINVDEDSYVAAGVPAYATVAA